MALDFAGITIRGSPVRRVEPPFIAKPVRLGMALDSVPADFFLSLLFSLFSGKTRGCLALGRGPDLAHQLPLMSERSRPRNPGPSVRHDAAPGFRPNESAPIRLRLHAHSLL